MSESHDEGVYLIEHEHGYIKLGRSTNPVQRLASLNTATPYEIHLTGFIKTNDAVELEAELHGRYEQYQKSGEWYNLPTYEKMHLIAICDLNKEQVDARYGKSVTDRRRSTLTYQGLIG